MLPAYRSIVYSEEYANRIAHGIICLGNQAAVRSYAQFPRVIGINNAIYPVNWEGWRCKDYTEGQKHFLFFSGRGHIHKGLDLVLEAFVQTDLHLHICQHLEPDFVKAYQRELTEYPNIHAHGYIKMRSPQFEALAKRCNWVISGTCAEGQPGAILECMAHGLIPILPDSANIDLEDWGVNLATTDVATIRAAVQLASQMSDLECRERASSVVSVTRQLYSVENFRKNLKDAVATILSAKMRAPVVQRSLAEGVTY